MADISMCCDHRCATRTACYRYRAIANSQYQSFMNFGRPDGAVSCDSFWTCEGRRDLTPMVSIYLDGKVKHVLAHHGITGKYFRQVLSIPETHDLWMSQMSVRVEDVHVADTQQLVLHNDDVFYSVPKRINGG